MNSQELVFAHFDRIDRIAAHLCSLLNEDEAELLLAMLADHYDELAGDDLVDLTADTEAGALSLLSRVCRDYGTQILTHKRGGSVYRVTVERVEETPDLPILWGGATISGDHPAATPDNPAGCGDDPDDAPIGYAHLFSDGKTWSSIYPTPEYCHKAFTPVPSNPNHKCEPIPLYRRPQPAAPTDKESLTVASKGVVEELDKAWDTNDADRFENNLKQIVELPEPSNSSVWWVKQNMKHDNPAFMLENAAALIQAAKGGE